ncbi:MAG: hypothetical protein K2L64_02375, partial [Ureaplasma sp.]|nr:hypothetical protein [Ureaplasma sp.]
MINNFIPSEWLMSFYSSLFSNMDFDLDFNNSMFNLLSIKAVDKNQSFKPSDYLSYYSMRPNDINFSELSNDEYSKIIYENIEKIINKYDLQTNQSLVNFIYQAITSKQNWNDIESINNSKTVIEFLRDATGINTEYNQLFYGIKYPELIESKIPNLFTFLSNNYNSGISKLFQFIFTDQISKNNLFYDDVSLTNVLLTGQGISYFYPNIDIEVINESPSKSDLEFIKNNLLKFKTENNKVTLSYLKKDLSYSLTSNELAKLTNLLPSVINYDTWVQYVDSIKTYSELNNLLFQLFTIFNDIYELQLSDNTIDVVNSLAILTPFYSENNLGSKIIIFGYIGIF